MKRNLLAIGTLTVAMSMSASAQDIRPICAVLETFSQSIMGYRQLGQTEEEMMKEVGTNEPMIAIVKAAFEYPQYPFARRAEAALKFGKEMVVACEANGWGK